MTHVVTCFHLPNGGRYTESTDTNWHALVEAGCSPRPPFEPQAQKAGRDDSSSFKAFAGLHTQHESLQMWIPFGRRIPKLSSLP